MKVQEKKVHSYHPRQHLSKADSLRSCLVHHPGTRQLFIVLVLEGQATPRSQESPYRSGQKASGDYLQLIKKRYRLRRTAFEKAKQKQERFRIKKIIAEARKLGLEVREVAQVG